MGDLIKAVLGDWLVPFLRRQGLSYFAEHSELAAALLLSSVTLLFSGMWKCIRSAWAQWRAVQGARDLHPYFTAEEVKRATRYYIPTQFQSVSPSLEDEPGTTTVAVARQKLIPWMLSEALADGKDDRRFYLVLAGSGMGKTTFMINLYLAYQRRWRWGRPKNTIYLMPLGGPDVLQKLRSISNPRNSILLLDAFDEDPNAITNYRLRMEAILDTVQEFREVIITCRTQFFPSEEEEPRETHILKFGGEKGTHEFTKLYLSPFNSSDVHRYLCLRYGRWRFTTRGRASRIAAMCPSLIVRPMLLNYMDDLCQPNLQYRFTYDVYAQLITRWIQREARRKPTREREHYARNLLAFSQKLAIRLYELQHSTGGPHIDRADIESFAIDNGVQLDDLDLRSRSLLNRNGKGQYKFAHKSILEYFLACEWFEGSDFFPRTSDVGMDQMRRFYFDMITSVPNQFACQVDGKRHTFLELCALENSSPSSVSFLTSHEREAVSDVRFLAPFKNLQTVDISGTGVSDLRSLCTLGNLQKLSLAHTPVAGLEPIAELMALQHLDAADTLITNLKPLAKLVKLRHLNLSRADVADLTPLSTLSDLQNLDISQTRVVDLKPLHGLMKLETLNLSNSRETNLSALSGLIRLKNLDVSQTEFDELVHLVMLRELQILNLSQTRVLDLSPLRRQSELRNLDISSTLVTDLAPLNGLTGLHSLNISRTDVCDLTPIRGLSRLVNLFLWDTPAFDLTPLMGLPSLQVLHMSLKSKTDLTSLSRFRNLRRLHVSVERQDSKATDYLRLFRETHPDIDVHYS